MGRVGLSGIVTTVLGSPVVERAAVATSAGKLRILAYHGIPDPAAFAHHLDHLVDLYQPVGAERVIGALEDRADLPRRAVWVTFDDGRPEVVRVGLPLLLERGIPATLYVCPGLIDTQDPFWWDVVALAGMSASAFKSLPDGERRARIDELTAELLGRGVDVATPQMTSAELRRWHDAGMDVGNHTWDHPLLDRCDDADQEAQIERAHEALTALTGRPTTFAYPNGNVTATARACVDRLGYATAVDFAHRLCSISDNRLTLPRLRIDTDASLPRFRAIAGGAHSAVFRLARRGDAGARASTQAA